MQTFDRYRLDSSDRRRVGGPAAHLITAEFMRNAPIAVEAIHVAEGDVVRVSRGSLELQDPFGTYAETRACIAWWRAYDTGRISLDALPFDVSADMPLARVGARVAEYADCE